KNLQLIINFCHWTYNWIIQQFIIYCQKIKSNNKIKGHTKQIIFGWDQTRILEHVVKQIPGTMQKIPGSQDDHTFFDSIIGYEYKQDSLDSVDDESPCI